MPLLRWGLLAVAVIACAWFALGAYQAREQDRATALIDQPGTPSPALTTRILALLDNAGTLNPDRNVALLRSQALTRAGRPVPAVRIARQVVVAEPRNIDAWTVLAFAAQSVDPALARLARLAQTQLAPPVPASP